ncbi:hypothetical protein LEP1GSC043_1343 [Leptospira weilii str. Ecochallenge]|uniref:Uncharacterized protein n=3 Tax=Leptospira weilii TaxID=28184 RepID=N1UCD9_9LEPT|nr:hypothetical protein LEP1GSC038_4704 [Leptospira weilii str. 2006001855]EMN91822.1 hypothetical protein LEP1GSC108_1818 [Leptospira weilii str. UI 13098]EMY13720.1 hypothetical protein LEP1GSC043_1343 [Leptospira weilii str. Ecochallenge]
MVQKFISYFEDFFRSKSVEKKKRIFSFEICLVAYQKSFLILPDFQSRV